MHFAAYMMRSFTIKKWMRARTSLGVEAGRWGGLGSLCALSISRSCSVSSGMSVRIRDCRNLVRSDCWTNSSIFRNLMLFLQERSSRSVTYHLIVGHAMYRSPTLDCIVLMHWSCCCTETDSANTAVERSV